LPFGNGAALSLALLALLGSLLKPASAEAHSFVEHLLVSAGRRILLELSVLAFLLLLLVSETLEALLLELIEEWISILHRVATTLTVAAVISAASISASASASASLLLLAWGTASAA